MSDPLYPSRWLILLERSSVQVDQVEESNQDFEDGGGQAVSPISGVDKGIAESPAYRVRQVLDLYSTKTASYRLFNTRRPITALFPSRAKTAETTSCLYLLPTHSATSDLLISSNSSGDDSPHHIIDNQQRSKTQRFMRHSPCMMSAGMWESYRCSENLSALVTSTDEYAESKRW